MTFSIVASSPRGSCRRRRLRGVRQNYLVTDLRCNLVSIWRVNFAGEAAGEAKLPVTGGFAPLVRC
ncbi:hypothetical protein HMPREF3193_01137 [Bifidobacterium breve]|nr:hypothetical protein HMPREF3193_01137 [Bifidobacterium breve]